MRVALQARVSSQEQTEGYSLDAQRRAFKAFVEARGWTVYREYIEEGKSAHTDDVRKRPVFKEAIDDALAGKYDVLVVHKIDRFSRKLRVTLEYLEKLGHAGVGFVSIMNQFDYSRPEGKFMLVMLGGLAELYSDNLSEETKKGWGERRAQGLYCGPLPFGAVKGPDGVPIPHPSDYQGLVMAYEAGQGAKSDRKVAELLNQHGYRTVGTHGGGPFTKDSVRGLLTNRFYVGEIPDGHGGWIKGRHQPFIDADVFEQVQKMRQANRRRPLTIRRNARTYSLSGLLRCALCEGPMWVHQNVRGRARIYCRTRAEGLGCQNRGTFLDVYEGQLLSYLQAFIIPLDYRERILKLYASLSAQRREVQTLKRDLLGRLERIKKLYEWGDMPEGRYLSESRDIKHQLAAITEPEDDEAVLERLQGFLADVTLAWLEATDEQRNRITRELFQAVWVRDDQVVAVRPRPELRAFFQISEECQVKSLSGDPGGI